MLILLPPTYKRQSARGRCGTSIHEPTIRHVLGEDKDIEVMLHAVCVVMKLYGSEYAVYWAVLTCSTPHVLLASSCVLSRFGHDALLVRLLGVVHIYLELIRSDMVDNLHRTVSTDHTDSKRHSFHLLYRSPTH